VLFVLIPLNGLLTDHVSIKKSVLLASFVFVSFAMISIAAFANQNPTPSLSLRLVISSTMCLFIPGFLSFAEKCRSFCCL
jgi:hypothetical protein